MWYLVAYVAGIATILPDHICLLCDQEGYVTHSLAYGIALWAMVLLTPFFYLLFAGGRSKPPQRFKRTPRVHDGKCTVCGKDSEHDICPECKAW